MADDVTVPGQTPALPTADDAMGPTVEELQAQLAERDRALQEREHDLKVVRQLVKDLDSDDPAVRLFAIHALHELTGQRYGYDYFADDLQRKPALDQWKLWLAQQEGTAPSTRPADDSRLVGGKTGD